MISSTQQYHLKVARFLAIALDTQFRFGSFRFGLGPLIGIIPGFGDVIENALSFYLVWLGLQMNIPTAKLAQMLTNIGFNFILGMIPFLGDIGDFVFKSNIRNLQILEEFAEEIIEGEIVENKRLDKSG